MLIIPLGIIVAFASKGLSLYLAKSIMISVSEEVKKSNTSRYDEKFNQSRY